MANNTAAEFLNKVLSDEALRARLADKDPSQAAAVAAELGYAVTAEELLAAKKQLCTQSSTEVVELDLEDMDRAAGGSRDWATQGCASTVEAGSACWSNDYCILLDVTYTHAPSYNKCPNCGNTMYFDRKIADVVDAREYYKCPNCGAEASQSIYLAVR